ncbi:hypothetical protein MMC28_000321 [Mycoblastus sanguinarius]|nr:hypothetical protein [Mycoblastus sanguinarius]
MPLTEIPGNHIRMNGQVEQRRNAPKEGNLHAEPSNVESKDSFLLNPSSIQSMLRNTTETGNVGQFSIKPSRVPLAPRSSQVPSSKTYATIDKQRHPEPYYSAYNEEYRSHLPVLSRQGTPASNGSSGLQMQSQNPHQGPYRRPSIEEYRSYSMTQSSYTSHSLTHRHPYANGNHHFRGDLRNIRPRSPFAYPTRLKRPGYRPSSPAISDISKPAPSINGESYGDPSSRTASPLSARAMTRYPQGSNRSDPVLRYYPSSPNVAPARVRSPSPSPTRPSTPRASPSLTSVTSSSRVPRAQALMNSGLARRQTPPQSPLFYDYTEAFEEQDHVHSVSMSTRTLAVQLASETVTGTYFEADGTSSSASPAELAAISIEPQLLSQELGAATSQNRIQVDASEKKSIQGNKHDFRETPKNVAKGTPITRDAAASVTQSHGGGEAIMAFPFPNQFSQSKETEKLHQVFTSATEQFQKFPVDTRYDLGALKVPGKSGHGSSSPTDSMCLGESPSRPARTLIISPPRVGSNAAIAPQPQIEIAETEIYTKATSKAESIHSLQPPRSVSFEGHTEHTEILSPTPERSIVSPSHRNRFSKILSIDEGVLEQDDLATKQGGKEKSALHRKDTGTAGADEINVEPRLRKTSLLRRGNSSKLNAARDEIVEEASDSEDDPQLKNGLRKTFCSPDGGTPQPRCQSSPITLTSTLIHRASLTPVILRRSPAMRKSTPSVSLPDATLGQPTENTEILAETSNQSQFESSDADPKRLSCIDKEFPAIPNEHPAVISFSPPSSPRSSALPFSFIPLIHKGNEEESVAQLKAVGVSDMEARTSSFRVKRNSSTSSTASPPGSRPWNLDTSYPWTDQPPRLEVTVPEPTNGDQPNIEKLPRFKLRVHRASSSSTRGNSPSDLLHGPAFRRKMKPNLRVLPGQINSSHDSVHSSPMQTRFVESFEYPSAVINSTSPAITLIPPSPAAHEVRSFFSDDSSQIQPRGSLRKRFSQFRAKTRTASTDEGRNYDRGLLSSALGRSRASGRSSRQSENTAGGASRASQIKQARWKMTDRFRLWWQRGEDKIRRWRWRMRSRGDKSRSASADMYAGV